MMYFSCRPLRELRDSNIFTTQILAVSRRWRIKLYQILEGHREISDIQLVCVRCPVCCFFSELKWIKQCTAEMNQRPKLGQTSHYLTPWKGWDGLANVWVKTMLNRWCLRSKFFLALFRNQSSSNATGVENREKLRTNWPSPCKIWGRGGQNVWVNFTSSAYNQTSAIYLTGCLSAVWEIRVWVSKKKETRKRGNCECIATWGSPTPRSPYPL